MKKHIDYKKIAFTSIPIFIFIVSLFFALPRFSTNDDTIIMNVLSGRLTGSPYPCTSFFSIFLGYIISSLYKIAYLPWYPALIIISIIIGQMCIFSTLYSLYQNKNINIIFKIFLFVFYLPFAIQTITRASFTLAATLQGVASIYFLYKKKLPLSLFLLMLSTMIRYESGFVACAFWGIYYIYLHFTETKKISLKFVTIGILALVLVLGSYFGDEIIKSHIEPKGYKDFRVAMHINYDFPKTDDFYENKKEILDKVGLDETLFDFSRNCYFSMDSRIDYNSINAVNKYSFYNTNAKLKNTIFYALSLIKSNTEIFLAIFIIISLGVYCIIYSFNKPWEIAFTLLVLIFSGLFFIYLSRISRVILRSVLTFVLPSLILLMINLSNNKNKISVKHSLPLDVLATAIILILFLLNRQILLIVFILLASIFLLKDKRLIFPTIAIFLLLSYNCIANSNLLNINDESWRTQAEYRGKIEYYTANHSDNIYVICNIYDYDDRMLPPQYSIYNLFSWGGTYVHSSAHILQMQKAGLEKFDVSEFTKKNIKLIDPINNSWGRDEIAKVLSNKNIKGDFHIVDYVDKYNIGVFQFINKE